jgi:hypothetical protein
MPQGVEVFDASGNSIFDSSSMTLRIAGVTTITGNVTGQTQSFTPDSTRDFFYFVVAAGSAGDGFQVGDNNPSAAVTYSSGTISFTVTGISNGSDCYLNIFWGDY